MAKRRARDHADDQPGHCADAQDMQRRRRISQTEGGQPQHQQSNDNPAVRNMQNPQQRRSACRPWPPAPDTHELHGGGGQRQHADESRRRANRPGKKRQRRQHHSRTVAPRVAPRHGFQRISRKARHDAPGDYRFQHGNQRHAQV